MAQLIDKESLAFQQEKNNIKVLVELFSEVALFKRWKWCFLNLSVFRWLEGAFSSECFVRDPSVWYANFVYSEPATVFVSPPYKCGQKLWMYSKIWKLFVVYNGAWFIRFFYNQACKIFHVWKYLFSANKTDITRTLLEICLSKCHSNF